eukprot:CAMPEP_0194106128 /NCGR_PEP_ID=MMETSP0150-20130528/6215_1 /TAXON_ID=122233 /ORGANISM="Chaetoceros debilis, Strain MM31A-1" /LENGTH=803 /DNA_ID=CAMNT_0038794199 /DNA_START=154 /DNA_END=2565 /DNA_ORIENTATION=+
MSKYSNAPTRTPFRILAMYIGYQLIFRGATCLSLFPYQQEGCDRLLQDKRLLLADEMGLGKTVQCIEAMNQIATTRKKFHPREKDDDDNITGDGNAIVNALVICPKSVLGVWESELQTWLSPDVNADIRMVTRATKEFPFEFEQEFPQSKSSTSDIHITLINYDLCNKYRNNLQAFPYDILICDEAHYLKSITAKRTEAVFGAKSGLGGIYSEYLWLLTGTPVLNRPMELFTLLRAIDLVNFGNFKEYTERYCDPKTIKDRRGNFRKDYSGAMNLRELSQRLQPIMLRRYKMDVLTELPLKFRGTRVLHSGDVDSSSTSRLEQERLQEILGTSAGELHSRGKRSDGSEEIEEFGSAAEYSNLVKYLGVEWIDMKDPDQRNLIMGFISAVRKETALMKVDLSAELIEDIVASGEKVVVFAHHREVIHRLVDKFGSKAVFVMGGMSTDDRTDAVRQFQEDDNVRILVGSIRAAGVGVTLTASSTVIFLEMDWSPGVMAQAEDRCHRLGQLNSVSIQYHVFRDTIDEWIAKSLVRKQDNIDQILPSESRSTSTLPKISLTYTLDFGKYEGLRLEDAPRDYIQYLIKKEMWRNRPDLWRALHGKNLIEAKPPHTDVQIETTNDNSKTQPPIFPAPPVSQSNDIKADVLKADVLKADDVKVSYQFDFGMHTGKMWNDTPHSYRQWIIKEGVWKQRANLRSALIEAGIVEDENVIKSGISRSSQKKNKMFPIKSFRLTAQCPYIIEELKARNIAFDEEEKKKITKLKKRLLHWHLEKYPDKEVAATREIELISCNSEKLLSTTTVKKAT